MNPAGPLLDDLGPLFRSIAISNKVYRPDEINTTGPLVKTDL